MLWIGSIHTHTHTFVIATQSHIYTVTVKLLLSHLFPDKCERRNTCLLIVRPVKVGSKKLLTNQFRLYEPPEQYVSSQSHDIWNALLFACRQFKSVALLEDSSGKVQRTVMLNNISCVFEFAVYKYIYQKASSEEAVPIIDVWTRSSHTFR